MTTITIELPDDVAKSAQQAGILSRQTLASIVRELVRDRCNARSLTPTPGSQGWCGSVHRAG